MLIRSLVAAGAVSLASLAHAELNQFTQPGTLKIDQGTPRTAILQVNCSPDRDGGALSIELVVTEANTRKDFDFDDFEGPGAAASKTALSHLAWASATFSTAIQHAATGWYAPQPPEAFVFGITQLSHRREELARLLNSMRGQTGNLVWTQTGFDDAKRQLVATFEFDATAAERLQAAASSCLPQILRPRKSVIPPGTQ
jgi:hypothetical protein